jgi:hypothetical protein
MGKIYDHLSYEDRVKIECRATALAKVVVWRYDTDNHQIINRKNTYFIWATATIGAIITLA